jgi:hypothetical protein
MKTVSLISFIRNSVEDDYAMKAQTRCLQLKTYLWLYFGILGYTRGQKQEKLQ